MKIQRVDIGNGATYIGLNGLAELRGELRFGSNPYHAREIAASVLSCYESLIRATTAERNRIANAIKAAETKEDV